MKVIRSLTIVLMLIAFLLAISTGCTAKHNVYPSIQTDGVSEYVPITHNFIFKDKPVTITIPVDKTIYTAAYNADKQIYIYEKSPYKNGDIIWKSNYYRSLMDDESLLPLYDVILTEMRKVKSDLNLDWDSYAELIITYVQTMPYSTDDEHWEPKFTIETVYEGKGDCDDKSLLAAALLSKEGYDVSLMLFEDEEHMALGIKLPESQSHLAYRNGYAYVETTSEGYVGWTDIELNDGTKIISKPQIIGIGNGTRTYTSINEVLTIYDTYLKCYNYANKNIQKIKSLEFDLNRLEYQINTLSKDIKNTYGGFTGYNQNTQKYNSLVKQYNNICDEYNKLIKRYNKAVDFVKYVDEHTNNRHLVYLKTNDLKDIGYI